MSSTHLVTYPLTNSIPDSLQGGYNSVKTFFGRVINVITENMKERLPVAIGVFAVANIIIITLGHALANAVSDWTKKEKNTENIPTVVSGAAFTGIVASLNFGLVKLLDANSSDHSLPVNSSKILIFATVVAVVRYCFLSLNSNESQSTLQQTGKEEIDEGRSRRGKPHQKPE